VSPKETNPKWRNPLALNPGGKVQVAQRHEIRDTSLHKNQTMSEIQKIWERKAQARMEDRERLELGEVTRDKLHWQNSIIPRDVAEDPEWKRTTLAAAVKNLGKPRSTLTLPASHVLRVRELKKPHH